MFVSFKTELIFCLIIIVIEEVFAKQIIKTKSGKVKGIIVTSPKGERVNVFYGIPYAEPPIGNLRFRHPVPVKSWDDTFNADVKPNSCWQPTETKFINLTETMWNANTEMSEDCLKLNIWVPYPHKTATPVMIWIHGGGFYVGTSTLDIYDGKILAAEGQVIVVSINYRLGALGFLNLGYDAAPGNAGLFDQIMALQWINDNIKSFGGDPGRMTLFGSDAGAVTINLLQFSSLSRHLFSGIILQSASALSSWGISSSNEISSNSYELLKKLTGIETIREPDKIFDCLIEKDTQDFIDVLKEIPISEFIKFPFTPVIDEYFLSTIDYDLKNHSILAGTNLNEGNYFNFREFTEKYQEIVNITKEDFEKILEEIQPSSVNKYDYRDILYKYTNWVDDDSEENYVGLLDKIVGDKYFTCPVIEMMQLYHSRGLSNLYMYHFVHRSSNHIWPNWMGISHGDEIPYVFGEPLKPGKGYTNEEKELSRNMIKYWSNFAKTGNPSSPIGSGSEWPPYYGFGEYKEEKYLVLDTKLKHDVNSTLRDNFCNFWRLEKLYDRKYDWIGVY